MAPKGDNVVVSNMKLENMFCMKGGKGEASYANNSQAQVITIFLLHSIWAFTSHFFYKLLEALLVISLSLIWTTYDLALRKKKMKRLWTSVYKTIYTRMLHKYILFR